MKKIIFELLPTVPSRQIGFRRRKKRTKSQKSRFGSNCVDIPRNEPPAFFLADLSIVLPPPGKVYGNPPSSSSVCHIRRRGIKKVHFKIDWAVKRRRRNTSADPPPPEKSPLLIQTPSSCCSYFLFLLPPSHNLINPKDKPRFIAAAPSLYGGRRRRVQCPEPNFLKVQTAGFHGISVWMRTIPFYLYR